MSCHPYMLLLKKNLFVIEWMRGKNTMIHGLILLKIKMHNLRGNRQLSVRLYQCLTSSLPLLISTPCTETYVIEQN